MKSDRLCLRGCGSVFGGGGALVAEGMRELSAESRVVGGELAVALGGVGQPLPQGGVGGALAGGDGW